MNREEAICKLEYSKKAYQMLIDEKVDSGKLVGKDVKGEWEADTPLDEVYKSMIDALEMAIKVLKQEPCEDAISRQAAVEAFQMFREYESNRSNKEWVNRIETVLNQLPPVNSFQDDALDKIRADILKISSYTGFELGGFKDGYTLAMARVLKIIDNYKYKAEVEPQESEGQGMTNDGRKDIPEDPKRAYEQGYHDGLQDGYLKGFKAVVNLITRVLTEIKP